MNLEEEELIFYKKGSILQCPGDESKMGYWVYKGLLRSYSVDSKGKEHNFMFAPENWIISDLESIEFHQPSILFIECMEDSWVKKIQRQFILQPSELHSGQNETIRLLARRVGVLQRRVLMLMSAPARERYLYFLDTYPELTHRLSLKHIASYLGITPEALSKIRRELVKTT
jgi:CRP-like cAMP-binding protein